MEDSVDSDLVLIVPSSVEDSDGLNAPTDNPLGISSKPLEHASQPASFACFQLSGRVQNSNSESSESLHMEEKGSDVIAPSPNVVHIDLSDTPSAPLPSGLSTTTSCETCESGDADSREMSPDLIPSSDVESNPTSHGCIKLSSEMREPFQENQEETKDLPQKNIYEVDTESYSQSNFDPVNLDAETNSLSSFLQPSGSRDACPSLVILTASQPDSEMKLDNISKTSQELDQGQLSEPFKMTEEDLDIDSQEIVFKDVSMRTVGDAYHKEEAQERDVKLSAQGMESQRTQDDLNLHLTLESQLFDGSNFPNIESQSLVIDEHSEDIPSSHITSTAGDTHNTSITNNAKLPATAHDSSDVTQNAPEQENPSLTKKGILGMHDSNCSQQSRLPQGERGLPKQASQDSPGSEGLPACTEVETHPGRMQEKLSSGESPPDYANTEKKNPDEDANSVTLVSRLPQEEGLDDQNNIRRDEYPPPPGDTIAPDNTQNLFNRDSDPDKPSLESRPDVFSTSLKTDEISPSMQSTYMDENNNRGTAESVQILNSPGTSFQACTSQISLHISSSYDASMEYSSAEHDESTVQLPIGELETQPFAASLDKGLETAKHNASDAPVRSSNCDEANSTGSENEIKEIIDQIINFAIERSGIQTRKSTVVGKRLQSAKVESKDDDVKSLGRYEFRPRSQPSQDIQLESPFRCPTSPPVREVSGKSSREKRQENKDTIHMDKDGNNNVVRENENVANDEHDKSSDTLPPDDNSGRDSDPLVSPSAGEIIYRATKTVLLEMIRNGEVIDARTITKKPKYYTRNPYPSSSSQSSNGSGYLADTSSISRTSSDSSTQTHLSQSPGLKSTHHGEPALRSESSGGSSTSSSSSIFLVPVHPPKSRKEQRNLSPDSKFSEKATSPISSTSPSKPSTSNATPTHLVTSPVLKEGRVILTPLSTELIASQGCTMGIKMSGDIATPPTSNINPPLSGSTPVEATQKDESSDITTSNSPEVGYPSESVYGSSFPFEASPALKMDEKSPLKVKGSLTQQAKIPMEEGIPVMARPARESYYYPGVMRLQEASSGKFTVLFEDDGRERLIRETDVLHIDMLPVGQEVYVQSDADDPTDWYSPGTIRSCWKENEKRGYVIEKCDSNSQIKCCRKYLRKQVIVKQEDLKKDFKLMRFQLAPGIISADVSLDNIIDGKRRGRRSTAPGSNVSSPSSSMRGSPSPSTSKTPLSSRKRCVDDSQSSDSSSCVPFPPTKKTKRAKLTYGGVKTPSKKSQTESKASASATYKTSTIFENCAFLLTSTTGRDHPSSEFDSPPCPIFGYNREDIRKKIHAGNGHVAKDFTQLMSCDRKLLYVISDSFCRTMNYFSALAARITCLSHLWIIDSTNYGVLKPIQAYILPAGYSLSHQGVVERSAIPIQPLSGLRVNLQMKDLSTWSPLLCIAGCESVSSRQDATNKECPLSCDVVVADSSCNTSLKERAKSLKIPVVSIEWIIQCLITSEKLPYDSHHLFTCFK